MITAAVATEFETHKFSMWASDCELTRQGWPLFLPTNLGNGRAFVRKSKKVDADNDIEWVTYLQGEGCLTLRVYND